MLPGLALAMWAQFKVKTAYAQAEEYHPQNGMSGAETAQRILDINGLSDVAIERTDSFLGDHYDPRTKVLRLSPGVYDGRTLAAVGVAAHECGHAVQHSHAYVPLTMRSALVPAAMVGTNLSYILILLGVSLQPFRFLALLGVALFSLFLLFTLITLPVEFDASRRARAILAGNGLVSAQEDKIVGNVLNAAALTYVAAAITAILQLLYYLSLVSRRSD